MTTEQKPIASLAEIRALRENLPGRDEAAETEALRRNAIEEHEHKERSSFGSHLHGASEGG